MPITNPQKKKLTQWMQDHNVRQTCPACGSESGWKLHEEILASLELDVKKKQAKPSPLGCVALVCKHCHYTMFFAAAPILGR